MTERQRVNIEFTTQEEHDMTLKATFSRIEEDEDSRPDEKIDEAARAYQLEHPDVPYEDAVKAAFTAMPKTAKAWADMNGTR